MINLTENQKRKDMLQEGLDSFTAGYDYSSLCFLPKTAKNLVENLAAEKNLTNIGFQQKGHEHRTFQYFILMIEA